MIVTINEYLNHLKDLEAKAAPGPWQVDKEASRPDADEPFIVSGIKDFNDEYVVISDSGCYPPNAPTAEFISEARTAIPKLIRICERMRGALAGALKENSMMETSMSSGMPGIRFAIKQALSCDDIINETEEKK